MARGSTLTAYGSRFKAQGSRLKAQGVVLLCVVVFAGARLAAIDEPTAATLEYVTEDASMVTYANVRALMASPLRDRLREIGIAHPAIAALQEWAGVSLERDVDDLVFSTGAAAGDAGGRQLLIVSGRFDSRRLEEYARAHGGRIEPYGGARIVLAPRPTGDAAIALTGSGLALVGDAPAVRRALDAKTGAVRAITDNVGFMHAVAGLDDPDAWSVATMQAVAVRAALSPDVVAQLPAIDWLAASGQLGPGARGVITALAHDETAAEHLRELVQGFMALARMQGARNPELREVLASATLAGEGTTVSVSFGVTPGLLDLIDATGAWRLVLPQAVGK
jgi:hypothetical protein